MPKVGQTRRSRVYFNEWDKFAAEWLGNLYPDAVVDSRDIRDLKGSDLEGYAHVGLFAGIGGWQHALDLAGWPHDREVWTISCPCQPFSVAGKRAGNADDRNLWPDAMRLIRERRSATIFGEQVASSDVVGKQSVKRPVGGDGEAAPGDGGPVWLDGVRSDLEAEGYAVGAAVLPAGGVGAPHLRYRLFWVAVRQDGPVGDSSDPGRSGGKPCHVGREEAAAQGGGEGWRGSLVPSDSSTPCGGCGESDPRRRCIGCLHDFSVADTESPGVCGHGGDVGSSQGSPRVAHNRGSDGVVPPGGRSDGPLGDAEGGGAGPHERRVRGVQHEAGPWGDFRVVHCSDKKARRVGTGVQPLAHGIPRDLGRTLAVLEGMDYGAKEARRMLRRPRSLLALAGRNRAGRLRGMGNAIVSEVAEVFIRAFLKMEEERCG